MVSIHCDISARQPYSLFFLLKWPVSKIWKLDYFIYFLSYYLYDTLLLFVAKISGIKNSPRALLCYTEADRYFPSSSNWGRIISEETFLFSSVFKRIFILYKRYVNVSQFINCLLFRLRFIKCERIATVFFQISWYWKLKFSMR